MKTHQGEISKPIAFYPIKVTIVARVTEYDPDTTEAIYNIKHGDKIAKFATRISPEGYQEITLEVLKRAHAEFVRFIQSGEYEASLPKDVKKP